MKKLRMLIPVLVLTLCLLVGCGCRNSRPVETTAPTRPSTETTVPTTAATTTPTTAATTEATRETTDATIDNGNGPLPEEGARGNMGSGISGNTGTGTGTGITGSITG